MAEKFVTKSVSTKGSISWRDVGKGVLVASIGAALYAIGGPITEAAQAGTVPSLPDGQDLGQACSAGMAAGAAYLMKQFGSGPKK